MRVICAQLNVVSSGKSEERSHPTAISPSVFTLAIARIFLSSGIPWGTTMPIPASNLETSIRLWFLPMVTARHVEPIPSKSLMRHRLQESRLISKLPRTRMRTRKSLALANQQAILEPLTRSELETLTANAVNFLWATRSKPSSQPRNQSRT